MKKFKKTLAVFLSCMMTLSTCMVSFAEELEGVGDAEAIEEAVATEAFEAAEEETETVLATDADAEELETLEIEANVDNLFKVPYISTYYFNPKPTISDNIQIPLYLTDYEQSEYLKNDTSIKLDLIYKVDGVVKTIKDIPLGDYTLTLGKLSEGIHTFSVQALDNRTGMKSHELFNELWVVDPAKDKITEAQTYYMTTSDLTTYKIKNNDSTNATDLINTRDGLNKLFADKQAAGYRKIVLLKGTYRINGEKINRDPASKDIFYITIPSHFTVDMNGSTFKLNPITVDKDSDLMAIGCLIRLNDAVDTHITNGTLVGDRFERRDIGLETEAMNKAAKGEAINTLLFTGGKYCTATNLTIKDTTGHTIGSGNVSGPNTMIGSYTKTAIINGKEVANENCSTSPMIDLTKMQNWSAYDGYIYISHLLGYKGIQGDSPVIYASFYDANQKFIETITGYQYRKIKVPEGAKYVRATVAGTIDNKADQGFHTITVQTQHLGDYYEFSDIDFYDTRTTAMAASCGNNVLIENCTYTRCGNSITPAAVDFEEGSEECQDYYYRNNKVLEAAGTVTLVDCTGYNHVYENNLGHNMIFRSRVMGGVFRNTNDSTARVSWYLGDKKVGAYGRVYNNNCGYIKFSTGESDCVDFKVKDSTIRCTGASEWAEAVKDKVIYENCTFPNLQGKDATFVNCTIQPGGQLASGYKFYGCTFKALDGSGEISINLPYNSDKYFENCKFLGKTTLYNGGYGTGFNLGTYKNCEFDDLKINVSLETNMGQPLFDGCKIGSSADGFVYVGPWAKSIDHMNLTFKNCEINHSGTGSLIYFLGKPSGDSQILFDGCIVNKTQGSLVGINSSNLDAVKDDVSIDIKFVGTTVDKSLPVNIGSLSSNAVRISYGTTTTKKNGLLTENGKIYYYINDVKQTGWQTVSSKKYYFGTDGAATTGWKQISNKWYYFNTSGVMLTGWQTISSKRYYLGTDGVMVTGWQTIDSKKYYLGTDGAMVTGTVVIEGKTYQFDSNGVFVKEVVPETTKKNGLLTENGKTYYYVDDVKQTGLQTVNNKRYYFDSNGVMQTGLKSINGRKYYFGTDGAARTGFQTVDGKTYYFGSDGASLVGFQTIDGKAYYFSADSVMATGIQVIGGKTFYYASNGVKQTGWQTINGKRYNFGSDGVMKTSWQTIDNKKYYFGTDGVMVTGIVTIDNKKYEFGTDGAFIKEIVEEEPGKEPEKDPEEKPEQPEKKNGFVEEAGKTYYYVDDVKQLGWKKVESVWYYFGADGVMGTDKWVATGSDWYYLNEDGTMATNKWLLYKGSWYYFGTDGIMLGNKWLSYKGAWYYFGEDGVMLDSKWLSYKGSWYYFGEGGIMLANKWLSYKGSWYYFNADGIMVTSDWVLSSGKWYYFNASGIMVTDKQVINGKTYNFNASGAWIN